MSESKTTLSGNWNYPTSIRFGAGRITELGGACIELGLKKPLLVTDHGLAALSIVELARDSCHAASLDVEIFKGVDANPSGENIDVGVEAYKQGRHDGVIAFGGGSSLDAGKAIALMAGQNRPIWDFEDIGNNWTRVNEQAIVPIIAVPTTAGTGSEVGRASVIRDVKARQKKIIFHPKMLPSIVIADAQLCLGMSAEITAATGMDALSHNLEAYSAVGYHPLADGIALEGIRLIKNFLEIAVKQGDNLEARNNMLAASMMGATAFQKGLGAMHAMAHPLGAIYNTHHGLLNAILMPYVLKHNQHSITPAIVRLAKLLELENQTFEGFLNWVLELREAVSIPHTLKKIGITSDRLGEIAVMAEQDPSSPGNPIKMDVKQYESILSEAINGWQ